GTNCAQSTHGGAGQGKGEQDGALQSLADIEALGLRSRHLERRKSPLQVQIGGGIWPTVDSPCRGMPTAACIELRVQAQPSGIVCGTPLEVDYVRKPSQTYLKFATKQ